MNDENELKTKRMKIYLAPLMPINPSLIKDFDKSRMNTNESQIFIYNEDIHREIFAYLLLEIGKKMGKKPTYKVISIEDLIPGHFNNESMNVFCFPEVLFVNFTSGYTGNPIYGPIFNKVVEERRLINRPTYLFFRGDYIRLRNLGITENVDTVNYAKEPSRSTSNQGPITYQTFDITTPSKPNPPTKAGRKVKAEEKDSGKDPGNVAPRASFRSNGETIL